MPITKFLDPKNDYAFKRIFGTEKNKDILIHFLNDVLDFRTHAKVKDVTFLKPMQDPAILAKKTSVVDVLCTDDKGHQYIVEMQVAQHTGFEKRAQYYAAKAYTTQANKKQKYDTLKEIVFLAITNFVMFPDRKEYKSDHVILEINSHQHYLKDFSFTFLELPKFNKDIDHLNGMIEKWTYFFKHAEDTDPEELAKIIGHDNIISKAYNELNQFYWTEAELLTYEKALKNQMDEAAALDAAEKKGEAKGKREIAKKMLAQGIEIEMISNLTGLSKIEINALAKERKT